MLRVFAFLFLLVANLLFVYHVPIEQHASFLMNELQQSQGYHDIISMSNRYLRNFTMIHFVPPTPSEWNYTTSCQQQIVKNIMYTNYVSEFFGGLLRDEKEKLEQISEHIADQISHTTISQCGSNHTVNYYEMDIRLDINDFLQYLKERHENDSTFPIEHFTAIHNNEECAQKVVELMIGKEPILMIAKKQGLTNIEKAVDFYLNLKLRGFCSQNMGLLRHAMEAYNDLTKALSREEKIALTRLFTVKHPRTIKRVTVTQKVHQQEVKISLNDKDKERSLNNRIETLESEISQLHKAVEIEQAEKLELKSKLQKELQNTESFIEQSRVTHDELVKRLEKLSEELKTSDVTVQLLKTKLAETEKENNHLRSLKENLELNKSVLDKNLTLTNDLLLTLQKTASQKIQEKDSVIEELSRLKHIQDESIRALQVNTEKFSSTIDGLKQELIAVSERNKDISSQNSHLVEEINNLKRINDNLQRENGEISFLKETIQVLKAEKVEIGQEMENLKRSAITTIMTEKENIAQQALVLRQASENLTLISSQMEHLNQTLNRENDELREKLKIYISKMEQQSDLQKNLLLYEARIKNLESEHHDCISALSTCRDEKVKIVNDKQVEKLVLKITSLENKISVLNNEKEGMVLKLSEYSQINSEMEKNLIEATEKITGLSSSLIEMKVKMFDEEKKCSDDKKAFQEEIENLKSQYSNTSSSCMEMNQQLQLDLEQVKNTLSTCGATIAQLEQKNQDLSIQLEEANEKVQSLAAARARQFINTVDTSTLETDSENPTEAKTRITTEETNIQLETSPQTSQEEINTTEGTEQESHMESPPASTGPDHL